MRNPKAQAAWGTGLALLLTAVPGAVASGAQPAAAAPGASGVGDPVFPGLGNGGYDVGSYDLDLAYLKDRTVRGVVRIAARTTQALSRFNLDSYGLDVGSVAVNGTRARFAQRGEELVVTPGRALPSGLDFTVAVRYTADPQRAAAGPSRGFVPTAHGFATATGPGSAHTFLPCNDHPSDKAKLTVRLTTPPGLVGIANGRPEGTTLNPDGGTTAVYRTAQPVSTGRMQVSVGSYTFLDRGLYGSMQWRDVLPAARAVEVLPALSLTSDQIVWAQDRLGAFPLDAYGILVPEAATAAHAAPSVQPQTLTVYRPDFLAQPEDRIGWHMMGELVQSWFGSSVTPKDWSAQWLVGGHAGLYSALYRFDRGWVDEHGHRTLEERMRALYARGDAWRTPAGGAIARPDAAGLFDPRRADAAALALYALLQKVGPEVFTKIERLFLTRYRDRSAGTDDFISLAEHASADPTVRPVLESWLYGTKTPPMPANPGWKVDHAR